jgi:hypothetical protein
MSILYVKYKVLNANRIEILFAEASSYIRFLSLRYWIHFESNNSNMENQRPSMQANGIMV